MSSWNKQLFKVSRCKRKKKDEKINQLSCDSCAFNVKLESKIINSASVEDWGQGDTGSKTCTLTHNYIGHKQALFLGFFNHLYEHFSVLIGWKFQNKCCWHSKVVRSETIVPVQRPVPYFTWQLELQPERQRSVAVLVGQLTYCLVSLPQLCIYSTWTWDICVWEIKIIAMCIQTAAGSFVGSHVSHVCDFWHTIYNHSPTCVFSLIFSYCLLSAKVKMVQSCEVNRLVNRTHR